MLVLVFEHGADQRILAVEMVVKRLLGDAGGFGDGVDADPRETFPVEPIVCGRQDPSSGCVRIARHGSKYTN